jgi:hypothetical protein
MIIDKSFDSDKQIEFLQTLIKNSGSKVFLILDNQLLQHTMPVRP